MESEKVKEIKEKLQDTIFRLSKAKLEIEEENKKLKEEIEKLRK